MRKLLFACLTVFLMPLLATYGQNILVFATGSNQEHLLDQRENENRCRRVLLSAGGSRLLEDYLPGAILCQIPKGRESWYADARMWKCQAILARTYICRLMGDREEIQEEELDLDYAGTRTGIRLTGGEAALQRLEMAEAAVRDTDGQVLKYEGEYILPLFHEMSAGTTRTGAEEFPYLQQVPCEADRQREDFETELTFPRAEFAQKVTRITDAKALSADAISKGIQTVKKDGAGYMEQLQIGTALYTGDEIRYSLGLPSSHFSIDVTGDEVQLRVQGHGHGYGFSQSEASAMLEKDWEMEEILEYFYPGAELITE